MIDPKNSLLRFLVLSLVFDLGHHNSYPPKYEHRLAI